MPNQFGLAPLTTFRVLQLIAENPPVINLYSPPDIFMGTHFESLDGWGLLTNLGATIALPGDRLDIYVPATTGAYAQLDKTPSIFRTTQSWAKKSKFKADFYFNAASPGAGSWWIVRGGPGTQRHVGFKVAGAKLYGSVSNGTTELLTAALEDWGATGFTKTKTLELDYKVDSVDFYVDGTKVATLSTGLPTGTAWANTLIMLYVYNDAGSNIMRLRTSMLKLIQEP